jgi:hypothetical protein
MRQQPLCVSARKQKTESIGALLNRYHSDFTCEQTLVDLQTVYFRKLQPLCAKKK